MNKKQADRRPDEKPGGQGQGKYDPSKPESGQRMPEVPGDSKRFGQPEGHPLDKQTPRPGTRGGGQDLLDGDRSDRESGRPIQLEGDDESQTFSPGKPGQGDAGARSGRSSAGRPRDSEAVRG